MVFSLYVLQYAKLRYQAMLNSEEIKPVAGGLFQVVVKLSTMYKIHTWSYYRGSGGMPLQIPSEITY